MLERVGLAKNRILARAPNDTYAVWLGRVETARWQQNLIVRQAIAEHTTPTKRTV